MQRCFELAQLGEAQVSPNPLVGAVLVHEGKIIGEGWHRKWGGAHAEVNCIQSVSPDNQHLVPHSTLYCSLEPCAHFGKTPPCTDLIVASKIPRLVVANIDPNPMVAGSGLKKLESAGVTVRSGVLEKEGQWLNRAFFTWITQNRPYIILKWAQTRDGFMGETGRKTTISSPATQRLVHRWRAASDAILVGTNTAVTDNPRLTVRYPFGKNPLRVVLDPSGRIPPHYHLLDDNVETWIWGKCPKTENKLLNTKVFPAQGHISLDNILEELKAANKAILFVEGGANLLNQFLNEALWDEIRVIENRRYLRAGIVAPQIPSASICIEEMKVGEDMVRLFAKEN